MPRIPHAFAVVAVAAFLTGCPPDPDPWPEENLGRIELTIDDVEATVWPGVDAAEGRHVRLLNGFFDGDPSSYWFAGFASRRAADVFWFCAEGDNACPFDDNGMIDRTHALGNPVFAVAPGDAAYSPFWLVWVVRVPEDYEADDLKSVAGIEAAALQERVSVERAVFDHGADRGPDASLMHCLLVLEGTELQGNGADIVESPGVPALAIPADAGWNRGYEVTFFDFTENSGMFPPASDSESVPLMPTADIFVFFRDCAGGSETDLCTETGLAAAAVSERGVELDLTDDGDRADNNNIISGFPRTDAPHPLDRIYSPLWRAMQVLVKPEHDGDVYLFDDSGDQNLTDAKTPARIREYVELGWVNEPRTISEMDSGNAIPGNDGVTFFNCPSQRPAP